MENKWLSKALEFMKLERFKVALHCCERGLQINARDHQLLILKGNIMEKFGEYHKALDCYDAATEANPKSAQAWFNKGAIHGNFGQYRKALGCFQEAHRQGHPNATEAIRQCQDALSREEMPLKPKSQPPGRSRNKFR